MDTVVGQDGIQVIIKREIDNISAATYVIVLVKK